MTTTLAKCARTLFLMLGVLPIRSVQAQGTPSATVEAFFAAFAARQWDEARRHLNLSVLETWRKTTVSLATAPPPRKLAAEFFMHNDSTMPRAVAEWTAERANARLDEPPTWWMRQVADVPTIEALRALSIEELGTRWLQARDGQRVMRAMLERRGCSEVGVDTLPGIDPQTVLGAVTEGDSLAWVLVDDVWSNPGPFRFEQPRMLTARRRPDRWVLEPDESLFSQGHEGAELRECPAAAAIDARQH